MDISSIILLIPLLLISLSFHEYMHGKVSHMLGDPTPQITGRLTMNPIKHLDPIGSLVLIITMLNGAGFGWAKPVMVNPRYYKNPRKGMMYVGLAGPGANIFLAIIFSLLLRAFFAYANNVLIYSVPMSYLELIRDFLSLGLFMNLGLAVFNLLPFPPLDGSKILRGFLPRSFDKYFQQLEGPIGMVIIMALAFTGALGMILIPVVQFLSNLLV